MIGYIYALRDPRDKRIYYVGQTTKRPHTRAVRATTGSGAVEKRQWLQSLTDDGVRPLTEVLEECAVEWRSHLTERERWWIAEMLRRGEPLTNHRDRPPDGNTAIVARLTQAQIEQLKRIGNGNLSEGIRRLLGRYETLIALWARNVQRAEDALGAARELGADTAGFAADLTHARAELSRLAAESQIWSALTVLLPSTKNPIEK